MFMGHLGIALAAKGARKDLSLMLLCVAAVAPDLIDFTLESRLPGGAGMWSHSLAAMCGDALLFYVGCRLTGHRAAAALLTALVGLSHVPLDLVTSRMVLWPGGPPLGLHLYRYRLADLCLECAVVLAGWFAYTRGLPPRRRFSWPSLVMLLLLLAMQGLMATVNVG